MPTPTPYQSKHPDADGWFHYSDAENAVWQTLVDRQMRDLQGKACDAYFDGVAKLGFAKGRVPQILDIDARLAETANFGVTGVPALIKPAEFYRLLSRRKFPVATFIRRAEDMDYLEEPDIFHEVFGHCPLLTNRAYTDFIEAFGKRAGDLGPGYSWHLFRLFWFTVEFGMIRTDAGLRAYGAGIVSSPSEVAHACGGSAEMVNFDVLTALRTPYRIDIVQPLYFVIDSFEDLVAALDSDMAALIDEAKRLGDFPAKFDQAA